MHVGLGTGSTVAHLLAALGERAQELRGARCVATSPATAVRARELGLTVEELDEVGELDIAIDGADQVDPDGLAGQGRRRRPHAREDRRRGGAAVRRDRLGREGGRATRAACARGGAAVRRAIDTLRRARRARACETWQPSPDGNLIADYTGPVRGSTRAGRASERDPGRGRARPVRARDGERDIRGGRGRSAAPGGRQVSRVRGPAA